MICRAFLAAILTAAGAAGASAQEPSSVTVPGAAGTAVSRGAELIRVAREAGLLPPDGRGVKCGLPLSASLRAHGAVESLLFPRIPRQTSIVRSGWRIHFDTSGTGEAALLDAAGVRIPGSARAFAESVGTALEHVIAVEQGGLGYPPPLPDGVLGGGPEPDVYIEELGELYGMTYPDVEGAAGAASTAFMTIDNDFIFVSPPANRGIPGMKVTVAHEFHHVIQLSRYGYWPGEIYYYEMTSTWMEDVVYTEVNDYLNYLWWSSSQFAAPTVPFNSNDAICYSRGIWCHFLAKRFGADVIRRSWEEIGRHAPLAAMDAALRERGSSFALAFSEWTRWNYYTGGHADTVNCYPEGGTYPAMARLSRQFLPPLLTLQGGLDPLASRYHEILIPASGGGTDTLTIAAARIDLGDAAAPDPGAQSYTFSLRAAKVDESYRETGTTLYAAFSAPAPSGWGVWYISGAGSTQPFGLSALAEGTPFPNPFRPDGRSSVSIPVDGGGPVPGSLQIFNTGMELVYSRVDGVSAGGVRQVFAWDGRTKGGALASSGVYLYILTLGDGRTMTGKIAVLRP